MPSGVEAGHQADTCRRADTARIRLRKLHADLGELLHVRRVVAPVEVGDFRVKRHRRVLPTHIVHQKQDDIGPFLLRVNVLCDGLRDCQVTFGVGMHTVAITEQLGAILKDGVEFQQGDLVICVFLGQLANPLA